MISDNIIKELKLTLTDRQSSPAFHLNGALIEIIRERKCHLLDDLKNICERGEPEIREISLLELEYSSSLKKCDRLKMNILKQLKLEKALSLTEKNSLSNQLKTMNRTIWFVERLKLIFKALQEFDRCLESRNLKEAAGNITIVINLLLSIRERLECNKALENSKIFVYISSTIEKQKQILKINFDQVWSEFIIWTFKEETDYQIVELRIAKDDKFRQRNLEAVIESEHLDKYLKKFSEEISTNIIQNIISKNSTIEENYNNTEVSCLMSFTLKTEKSTVNHLPTETIEEASKIIERLKKFLSFLVRHFSADDKGDKILIRKIGAVISRPTFKSTVETVLDRFAPDSVEKLTGYEVLLKCFEDLYRYALESCLINKQDEQIKSVLKDGQSLFLKNKCNKVLLEVRRLCKLGMYDTFDIKNEVNSELNMRQVFINNEDYNSEKVAVKKVAEGKEQINLMKSSLFAPFKFPVCQISISIKNMIDFIWQIIDECHETDNLGQKISTDNAFRALHRCVRESVELFIRVISFQHRDELINMPIIAALFHNNCYFVSVEIIKIDQNLRKKCGHLSNPSHSSLVDLSANLQTLADGSLSKFVNLQNKENKEFLNIDGGFANMGEENNFKNVEQCLNKIFIKLRHLNKVWRDVLPSTLYRKTMGSLLDSTVADINNAIIRLDDISEDDGEALNKLIEQVFEFGTELFRDSSSRIVEYYVTKWVDLKEMQFVLTSRLQPISDRWYGGKGPLAQVFTFTELDKLIRALFQNTELRSIILASINKL